MKKRLFLIIFLILFIFGCNSYFTGRVVQQTTTSSEYRVILINSIVNYLTSPNNAILNVNEIKDLLFGYFSTHNNIIDLSIIGTYSHESLVDIYNKAKGTNFPGVKGKWYDVLTSPSTLHMDTIVTEGGINKGLGIGFISWYSPGAISIAPGTTIYFVADPAKVGAKYGAGNFKDNTITLEVRDMDQSPSGIGASVYVVDRATGDEVTGKQLQWIWGGDSSGGIFQGYMPITYYDPKTIILVELKGATRPVALSIWWH